MRKSNSMVYSCINGKTVEVSCEQRNVLKRASDNAASRRWKLFEDLSFSPLLPLEVFFTDNTWDSMETFEHSDIEDNSCLAHSHSFPTFERDSSISQQTW